MVPVDLSAPGACATRMAEHVHGHLGWLAAAALVHPAVLLRNTERRAHLAVGAAAVLATVAAAIGMGLYPAYRQQIKPSIFAESPALGFAFERKEHLAFGAIALVWAGASAYAGALAAPGLRRPLRRAAHACFVVAAAFALATATLGTIVAAYRTF